LNDEMAADGLLPARGERDGVLFSPAGILSSAEFDRQLPAKDRKKRLVSQREPDGMVRVVVKGRAVPP
jgi:hypothetical protein